MNEGVILRKYPEMPDPQAVQRAASDPHASVWVGASAGSGKTTVLVARVLRLLLAGVKPQRILCLTFTRAAAAEMSLRITARLSHWATCSDDELRRDLDQLQDHAPTPEQPIEARRLFARMLACPGGMRIRTIHAFCQEILRRFPIEAGLPPHFNLIEEIGAQALREEAQAELLRAASDDDSRLTKSLRLLVRDLGEYGFQESMDAVLSERAKLASAITKAGGLEPLVAGIREKLQLGPDECEEKIRIEASDHSLPREDLLRMAELLKEGTKTHAVRAEKMLIWLNLPAAERAAAFDDWCCCFFTGKGEFYSVYGDKKLLEKYPDLDPLQRREAMRLASVKERLEAARIAEGTEAVLRLGTAMLRCYEKRKKALALLDYDDLILTTDRLLQKRGIAPWVLYKLDGGLDHILVDEAQDTSRAQWNIVKGLTEEFFAGLGARPDAERTLFVVGDEKQSIFSFQHADPAAFAEMRHFFERRSVDADRVWKEVPLHMSFRSAPAILKAVDAVFADPHVRQGVSTNPVEHYAAKNKLGRVEVWPLIPAPEKNQADSEWVLPLAYETERDPQAELAVQIAGRIQKWIEGRKKLPGHARPITAGDIMILLRRRGRFADLMVRALKDARVAVTGVDRMRLIKQLAVMDLCALIQFALLPEDDLNLACILRGPLLNTSEEQLMDLAIGRKASLWQSLKDKADNDPVYARARDYLQEWLGEADYKTPLAMLTRILNHACPAANSGRQALWARLGPDALDPIDELLNAAQEFGRQQTPSLQGFLHWLTATEAEIKRELDQGGGQVRIMTVHASKGLEAPIVFLPDTANVPRAREMPKLLWEETGLPLYLSRKPQTPAARRAWDQARRMQIEEYRRLFYVALTRAAEQLYICGWEPKRAEGEGVEESWYMLAQKALRPLHETAGLGTDEPVPDIVFADHGLPEKMQEGAPKAPAQKIRLPDWVREPASPEKVTARPLAPSHLAAQAEPPTASPDQLYARGRIIHRLLESLPDVEDAKRDAVAARFLANPQHRLPPKIQKEIAAEVLGLLRNPDYAPLFSPGSQAEVSIAGAYKNNPISGQIDRLCVQKNEIWIIDYKSNRPPPERVENVSLAYFEQLAVYRAVLQSIHPDKQIRCFLLWTYKPLLMPIPNEFLDRV